MEFEEKIDRYLLGEMDPTEQKLFEESFSGDTELQHRIALRKLIIGKLRSRQEIQSIMMKAEKEIERRKKIRTYFAIAASIILLIGIGLWLPDNQDNAILVEQYAAILPKNIDMAARKSQIEVLTSDDKLWRGADCFGFMPDECETVNKAMNLFLEKDYEGVVKELKLLKNIDKKSAEFTIYLGISFIKTNEAKQAIHILESAINFSDKRYLDDLHYYLAMAYILDNQKKQAKMHLKKIPGQSSYSIEAKQVLKKLKWF